MTETQIIVYPDHRLRAVAKPVAEIDEQVRELAACMVAIMHKAEGIGLAATQVGSTRRMIVVDIERNGAPPLMLANPEIKSAAKEINTHEEGCLSIPGVVAPVQRPASVEVTAIDIASGEPVTIEADALLATCLQHEIDHLDGVLFIDHLSRLRRTSVMRQYRKLKEAEADG